VEQHADAIMPPDELTIASLLDCHAGKAFVNVSQ